MYESNEKLAWKAWEPVVWGALLISILISSQHVGLYAYHAVLQRPGATFDGVVIDGNSMAFATFCSMFTIFFTIKFILYIKKTSFLGAFQPSIPNRKAVYDWLVVSLLFWAGLNIVSKLVGKSTTNEFILDVYNSSGFVTTLMVSVIFVAPVVEEMIFRGVILNGLENNLVSFAKAAVITSFLFTILHQQYDWFELMWVFIFGLILAEAKRSTGGILVPIGMHSLFNTASFISIATN